MKLMTLILEVSFPRTEHMAPILSHDTFQMALAVAGTITYP